MNVKKRQINIELLRIISMILVLLNHSTWSAKYFNIDMVHTDLPKAIGVLEVYGWIFVCALLYRHIRLFRHQMEMERSFQLSLSNRLLGRYGLFTDMDVRTA